MFKAAFIAMTLLLFAGCGGVERYVKAIVGNDGGPFRKEVLDMVDRDDNSLENHGTYVYQGRIPRDLRPPPREDKRFKPRAVPFYRFNHGLEFTFEKAEDGRICFLRQHAEYVGRDESLKDTLDRLTRIATSYEFAIETHMSIDAPEVRTRDIWPSRPAPDLDTTEVVDSETRRKYVNGEARTRLTVLFRDCGDLPPLTQESRFLTLAVRPNNSAETDDPYVLFWVLTDAEGKGSIREDATPPL